MTESIEQRVLHLYTEEYRTLREIRDKLDISRYEVTRILENHDIKNRESPHARKMKDEGPNIAKAYKRGATLEKLKEKYHTGSDFLKKILKKNGVKSIRDVGEAKHRKNALKVDLTMNKNLGYILGVLIGDGSVYKASRGDYLTYCIALHVKNKDFALAFREALEKIGLTPTFCTKQCSRNPEGTYWYVLTSNRKVYRWYQNFEYQDIKKEKKEVQLAFLRGFYESEGTYLKRNTIAGCGKDEKLINFVKELCVKNGFSVRKFFTINNPKNSFSKEETKIYLLRLLNGQKGTQDFIQAIKPHIKYGDIL